MGFGNAGMKTTAFCETDTYCRNVLRRHWPDVPVFDDIRNLNYETLRLWRMETPGVISAGFPCQDISDVGRRAGIDGPKSGLWRECARIIGELRPAYVVLENVPALRARGLDRVLVDLWTLGYDAEWHIIAAADVGAPHLRERIWIVAYDQSLGRSTNGPVLRSLPPRPIEKILHSATPVTVIGGRQYLRIPENLLSHDDVSEKLDRDAVRAYGNAIIPKIAEIIGHAVLRDYEKIG